jgi:RNA 2',3'-cyclic 3'-phosphodiesterase
MEARELRLFFALPLPRDLRERLGQWGRSHAGVEGWSRTEDLHLTLAFLGLRPGDSLDRLASLAAPVALRHGALALRTASLGSFSPSGTARLLWLGLAPSPALAALAEDLRGALLAAGEAVDLKPFHPHLTLARFRRAQPLGRFRDPPVLPFTADRFTLFESRPLDGHAGLRSWSLQEV